MNLKLFLLFCILHLIYVQDCNGCIYWVPMKNGSITMDAVQGGWDNEPLYVSRVHVQIGLKHALIPGSLYPSNKVVQAATYQQAFHQAEYELLGNCIAEWDEGHFLRLLRKDFPALIAGYGSDGEALYVCRSMHETGTLIGWALAPSEDSKCHIPKDGTEHTTNEFQYLFCKNV